MSNAMSKERPIIVRGECVRFARYRIAPALHEPRRHGEAKGRGRKRRVRVVAPSVEAAAASR